MYKLGGVGWISMLLWNGACSYLDIFLSNLYGWSNWKREENSVLSWSCLSSWLGPINLLTFLCSLCMSGIPHLPMLCSPEPPTSLSLSHPCNRGLICHSPAYKGKPLMAPASFLYSKPFVWSEVHPLFRLFSVRSPIWSEQRSSQATRGLSFPVWALAADYERERRRICC